MFIDFRERGKERERDKNIDERETVVSYLPYTPQLEMKPAT